jgi:dihydroneopterin aldolase
MWIRIQSLSLFAYHGAYDEERSAGNHFEIDVDIQVPDTFGGRDDLVSTLDYVQIFDIVTRISERTRYTLLERFCDDICTSVFSLDDAIGEVIVRVRKLNPPAAANVRAVEVERSITR